jgi:hypothetical protein
LRSRSKANSPDRFPCLEHVTLHHRGWEKSLKKLTRSFRDLVTKVELSKPHGWSFIVEALDHLTLFPKLRELEVGFFLDCTPKYLRCCTSLETLKLDDCTLRVARAVVTLTSFTSLHIGHVKERAHVRSYETISWLEHVTTLSKLQDLQIDTPLQGLPLIGKLTGLTGLTWMGEYKDYIDEDQEAFTISPLTCLSQLKSVALGGTLSKRALSG